MHRRGKPGRGRQFGPLVRGEHTYPDAMADHLADQIERGIEMGPPFVAAFAFADGKVEVCAVTFDEHGHPLMPALLERMAQAIAAAAKSSL